MQSKFDSLMESITNIFVGFFISLMTYHFVSIVWHLHTKFIDNVLITGVFTITSLIRQYTIRRLFNGKSIWEAIRGSRAL